MTSTCSTKKAQYRDQGRALAAMRTINDNNPGQLKLPIDVYKCSKCKQWHLTSRPRGSYGR